MDLKSYRNIEQISESRLFLLQRALAPEGGTVILKCARRGTEFVLAAQRLRREYNVHRQLQPKGPFPEPRLVECADDAFLVFEDHDYQPLDRLLAEGSLEISLALKLGCNLAGAIASLHHCGYIHRDIHPENVLFNTVTAQTMLHGFGLATQVPRTIERVQYPRLFEGSPAYMSPELSGRTNQLVDYRTDFYSLGVNLFQIVTGRLPFQSEDPLELIHAHVAKHPPFASEVAPGVPRQVSEIIQKLMAKSGEERYQGGYGLRNDLERCLSELENPGNIRSFELAKHDPPSRFELHQRFYGRSQEKAKLLRSLDEVGEGALKVVLVAGHAGVGKTSLVYEIKRAVLERGGWFVAGKYDALERETPYSGIGEALLDLWRRVVSDTEELERECCSRLEQALGPNLGVIMDVVPEMRSAFESPPEVPELDPVESKNRFHLCFHLTLKALATPDIPLVFFLDDLQWADPSSLELIEGMLDKGLENLFFLGAYRENEVNERHPLLHAMRGMQRKGLSVETLSLSPLEMQDVRQLVANSLRTTVKRATPLTDLVFRKTAGNAFYVKDFLTNIYDEGLLFLDNDGAWGWDLPQIAGYQTTEYLNDLAPRKLALIPSKMRPTIALAAALGRTPDLEILAAVRGASVEEVEAEIIEACKVRILLKNGNRYQFEHDRLQEFAYSLVPESDRARTHLRIGRLIAERGRDCPDTSDTFTVLDHLNQALSLLVTPAERVETARMNLHAGRMAKSAPAFPAAAHYFTCGLSLLSEKSWSDEYALALALHTEAAEAAFLIADFREAERLVNLVLSNAATLLDKVPVYETLIAVCHAKGHEDAAFRITLDVAALLGVEISLAPVPDEVNDAVLSTKRAVEELLAQPEDLPGKVADSECTAAMRLLTRAAITAGMVNHQLYLVMAHKLFELARRHPASPETPVACVMAGGMLCYILEECEIGFKVADRGMQLLEQSATPPWRSFCNFLFAVDINCWRLHYSLLSSTFIKTYRMGLESGDLMTASISAYYCCETALYSGMELSRLEKLTREYYENSVRLGVERVASGLLRLEQISRTLKNGIDVYSLSSTGFQSPVDAMQAWQLSADQTVQEISLCHEIMALCIYRQLGQGFETSLRANALQHGSVTALLPSDFYICLTLLDAVLNVPGVDRAQLLAMVAVRQERILRKARICTVNHRHKFDMVEAQRLRVTGDVVKAMACFDRAIEGAKSSNYVHEEALALELAAEFYLHLGRERISAMYLHDAIAAYGRWGAWGKIDQLYDRYRKYLASSSQLSTAIALSSRPKANGGDVSDFLDISSIERAAAALTREIDLQKLLQKFVEILLQNAGAQRGFLLRDDGGQLVIEASGSVDGDVIKVLGKDKLSSTDELSHSIVRLVSKTLETVVIGNATRDGRFAETPYIVRNKSKSILCAPVLHGGKPLAILYLENNRSTDAFSADRLAAIQVISAQAANAIENASLLEGLRQEVSARRMIEENLHKALDEVALLKDRLHAENTYLREEILVTHGFDEIVGKSEEMKRVLNMVGHVAATDATVLILGETGTGKELIARAIHKGSARKDCAMVKVNCAALPATLIESELFGHEKGAYTGAHAKKVGRFELADGGSIFLDEIGELPLELQSKLLRVLQEGEFERLGSSVTRKVSARVIAATNRDLRKEVEEGRFRSDLFYRLSVFPIELPPLRERKEDIPVLVWYFMTKKQGQFGKSISKIPVDVMDILVSYHWPGNIRELENVIERAMILGQGSSLALDYSFGERRAGVNQKPTEKSLDEVERRHIQKVLEQCGWKVKGEGNAADQLGLNPSTLFFRMRKLGIQRPRKSAASG